MGYPPTCNQQLSLGLELQTYQDPKHLCRGVDHPPGADQRYQFVGFLPSVSVEASASSRTRNYLDVDLKLPQETGPFPTASDAKSMTIDLGGALRLDQAAIDGHAVCTAAEARIGTEQPPACSAPAKVGTVKIQTPVVPQSGSGGSPLGSHSTRVAIPQVAGSAYFGGPEPGGGYRVYLLPRGFGIEMKLQMLLKPDPKSGDLVASIPVLPPFPLSEIDLEMPAASGVVETAVRCAPYVGSSTVTPGTNRWLDQVFQIQPLPLSTGPGAPPARARRRAPTSCSRRPTSSPTANRPRPRPPW